MSRSWSHGVFGVAAIGCLSACAQPKPSGAPARAAWKAQVCKSDDGGCDAIIIDGFMWNGRACVHTQDSGCGAVGPDCARMFETQAACETAFAGC